MNLFFAGRPEILQLVRHFVWTTYTKQWKCVFLKLHVSVSYAFLLSLTYLIFVKANLEVILKYQLSYTILLNVSIRSENYIAIKRYILSGCSYCFSIFKEWKKHTFWLKITR